MYMIISWSDLPFFFQTTNVKSLHTLYLVDTMYYQTKWMTILFRLFREFTSRSFIFKLNIFNISFEFFNPYGNIYVIMKKAKRILNTATSVLQLREFFNSGHSTFLETALSYTCWPTVTARFRVFSAHTSPIWSYNIDTPTLYRVVNHLHVHQLNNLKLMIYFWG